MSANDIASNDAAAEDATIPICNWETEVPSVQRNDVARKF